MSSCIRRPAALLALWSLVLHPLGAQAPSAGRADSAFQRKDWSEAVSLYGAMTKANGADAMAWFRLGASQESQRNFREAAVAYQRAVVLGFQPLQSELRLTRVYAQLHDNPEAFKHLHQAAQFGFPGALIDNEPLLEPLRALPEYAVARKQAEDVRYPCRSVHTFDFWAGTFDAMPWNQPGAPSGGVLTNSRSYDGCVLIEYWSSNNPAGGKGMSMSFYDVNRKVWRMIWNDDNNSSNDFEGSYHDGGMRFEGWVLDADGKRILASNVLQDVDPQTIRHIYSTSPDSGKTWNVQSDGRFVRRAKTDGP